MKRNIGLDSLKVLGCFAVVILHVSDRSSDLLNLFLYYMASCAVPIFFMVNGNLLLNKDKLDYNYVFKKILNIFNIVFLWNLVLFGIKVLIKHEFTNPLYITMENFLQKEYFWQFWFFGGLIIIYLVLPIIYKYYKSLKGAIIITGTCIVISLFIDLASIFRANLGYSIIQVHVIQTFRIWTWLSYFLIGGLIRKSNIEDFLKRNITLGNNIIIVITMTIGTILYQYNMAKYIYKIKYAEYFYDNILTFIWVSSLFLLLYRLNYSNLKSNIIYGIGNNIMGIYIIHVTMIKIITHFYGFQSSFENIFLIFLVFMSSLILASFINMIPIINRLVRI